MDDVLGGGLIADRVYLVEGTPGTGKTTLALQFLLEGRARGERGLYVTLSETTEELELVAASHGWSLKGLSVFELPAASLPLDPDSEQTLLHPWEVELGEVTSKIFAEVERSSPSRVVFDSLSEMRLLAQDPLRYRRQILALKQYFAGRRCTVLLLDDRTSSDNDLQLHSISHGVLTLERLTPEFGPARRRLEVLKMRGASFRAGYHDMSIVTGGVAVYPRLIASEHHAAFVGQPVSSGVPELDALLQGGPLRGTSTLLLGPAGSGKTTIAMQYALAAARRGERAAIYQLDERLGTMMTRSAKLGMDLQPHVEGGRIRIQQVDPASLTPGEFERDIRAEVEGKGLRLLVIDSLNGYLTVMSQERQLLLQIRELLSYLNQKGVVTFLLNVQQGLIGTMQAEVNISFVADAVLLLRFFEADGRIRKALSVLKNRAGGHEDTIREVRIGPGGVRVGEPLTDFRGVLTGTPHFSGGGAALGSGPTENG